MSIVPYATNRQVVLRHNDQVVVYDPQSRQLGVRNATSQRGLDVAECPYCHQPWRRGDRSRDSEHGSQRTDTSGFVSPEYFRMLQDSHPGSTQSSSPPSPVRRLVEPVRSGLDSSPHSGATTEEPQPTAQGISASAFSPGYFQRFFVVEKELGRGGKGVVLLVTHILDNVELGQYACKRVPVGNDHAWLTSVLGEVRLLEHLSHQHLVYYKHVWLEDVTISKFGPSVPCAFILQQFCNSGDLHQYVVNEKSRQDELDNTQALKERARRRSKTQMEPPRDLQARKLRLEQIYSFFKDITSGLHHLHLNGFIHRDLKPNNCLLHDAGQGLRVLVSDFGEVQVENMVRKSTGATGTVSYCAPEVLRRSPDSGDYGNFTTKSDIFSLGMILYFLCFAQLPYRNADHLNEENEDLDQLRDEIIHWDGLHEERKLRPDLPEQLYTFLRRLLSLNPEDRPSAEEILLGIKTGSGLDEISDTRPNAAAHIFDDLSASSRISPVDSPRSSTPANRKNSGVATSGFTRPSGAPGMKLRMSSFQRDRHRNHNSINTRLSNPPSPSSPSSNGNFPPSQPGTPSDSLILRPQFPSPARSPTREILAPHYPPALPAPDTPSTKIRDRILLLSYHSVPLTLVLIKALSLNFLCTPMATNSYVAIPLLILAAVDALLLQSSSSVQFNSRVTWTSIALASIHVITIWLAQSRGVLCSNYNGDRFFRDRRPEVDWRLVD